ncbi:MAG: TonB-dependent receptor [Acidobacteriota bacterium]|nr:TonB-dependent receptor [Acidobacteriota bacterium]
MATTTAQVQTGSIRVRATDEQGAVMPGVTVTLSSPALISGTAVGVTDASGVYRFPALVPGTYSVRLELVGFQTVVRENLSVLVGQTIPVEITLNVATVAEVITVSGASPTVDTTSANVNVNLGEQLLQNTPGGRDIWGLVEYKVPSLTITRPDVGGTSGGLQGVYSARGTTSAQNTQFLNGVNVGDPAAIGAAGFYYDYDAFEDIQVSTGAHDITVPTGGVFLNMVTKSGGDSWRGRAFVAWLGNATQRQNIDGDLLKYGFREDTNSVDFVSDATFNVGGPIVRNKLRFFGSFRDWRVHVNVPAAFSTNVLDQTNITSGLGNLTYQATQNHKFTAFYSWQKYDKPNRFLVAPTTLATQDSTVNEQDIFHVFQTLWNGVLTNRFFVDARFGFNKIKFPTYQNTDQQTLLDQATNIRTRNFNTDTERFRDRYQANATAQYYIDQALGGRHELKFGFDHAHAPVLVNTNRVDQVEPAYNSSTGLPVQVTLFGSPFQTRTAVDVTALFFQDSYVYKRMTLTGGLRWERLEGYLPEQNSPPSPLFPSLQRSFPEQRDIVNWKTVGPRASVAYDLLGDARTALKGSYGRYYYVISTGGTPLDNVNPNANYSEQYVWNDINGDRFWQAGEQTGPPVITAGTTTTIDPNYKRPYTDEFTAGLDRELMQGVGFNATYTYRAEKDIQALYNPANPFASELTTRPDPGPDGVPGTDDDSTYQFYDRLSGANPRVVSTDPTRRQTYKGLELTVDKRMSNRWQMLAGYTFGRTSIRDVSMDPDPNALINANGRLADQLGNNRQIGDRPHNFKLTGSYITPLWDILIGANVLSQSGAPITRFVNTRLSVGGTTNVAVTEPGASRLPSRSVLDLRVSKSVRFSANRTLDLNMDLSNVFNNNVVWDARNLSGTLNFLQGGIPGSPVATLPQFLSPAAVLAPMNVRFSAAFRF